MEQGGSNSKMLPKNGFMQTLYGCAQSLTHRHNNKVWVTIQKHKQHMIPLWGLILSTSSHYLAFLTHTWIITAQHFDHLPLYNIHLAGMSSSCTIMRAVLREDFLLWKVHSETRITAVMTWISRLWTGPVLTTPPSLTVQHKEICQTAIIFFEFHLLSKKHTKHADLTSHISTHIFYIPRVINYMSFQWFSVRLMRDPHTAYLLSI